MLNERVDNMRISKKIRVLVVDDSLVFREAVSRGISTDAAIEVVAKAVDPFDARDKVIKFEPDVMICDVEMPKMNGIEFIKQLLPQYTLPIIVVSAMNKSVFDAINAGAVDFAAKPDGTSVRDQEKFISDLIKKVKIANRAKISRPIMINTRKIVVNTEDFSEKIIAIGASTGGIEAISSLLKAFPSNMPGILITQHIPPEFSRMFAERLDNQLHLEVKEARNGDIVEKGKVLIAPGDQHMRLKRVGNIYKVEVFKGEKVSGHCPSVDVLFQSVANEAGSNAIGIILTGMGYDGASGLLAMRCKEARTIGQNERSCIVYGMPKVAFNIGAVEKQLNLTDIPRGVLSILENK
ncbi:MAG: chemotaxis response regulator containing a CheY-like receiver domain and a methylesterase domain [Clostridia bacterium]|nr:chemotaxis response regulator containing a CheY-like receiver domain and a methylesterase domain [Clostridia bacterium]